MSGSEAKGYLVVDSPWRIVGASVGAAIVTAALYAGVDGVVVLVAASDGALEDVGLSGPGAGRLTAVPVPLCYISQCHLSCMRMLLYLVELPDPEAARAVLAEPAMRRARTVRDTMLVKLRIRDYLTDG